MGGANTLAETPSTVQSITGRPIRDVYVDKGYRGHGVPGPDAKGPEVGGANMQSVADGAASTVTPVPDPIQSAAAADPPPRVHIASTSVRNLSRIERYFLTGLPGDAINIVLAAAASNFRKLLRRFVFALREWLQLRLLTPPPTTRNTIAAESATFSATTRLLLASANLCA